MKMLKKEPGRHGEIRRLEYEAPEEALPQIIDFIPRAAKAGEVDITQAPALVVLGKGACNSRYLPRLEELAGLLDFWILGARSQTNVQWDYRLAIAGALTGGMQVPLGKRFFLRLSLDFAVAALRYEYRDPRTNQPAFSTPSVFGDAALAFGVSLR